MIEVPVLAFFIMAALDGIALFLITFLFLKYLENL